MIGSLHLWTHRRISRRHFLYWTITLGGPPAFPSPCSYSFSFVWGPLAWWWRERARRRQQLTPPTLDRGSRTLLPVSSVWWEDREGFPKVQFMGGGGAGGGGDCDNYDYGKYEIMSTICVFLKRSDTFCVKYYIEQLTSSWHSGRLRRKMESQSGTAEGTNSANTLARSAGATWTLSIQFSNPNL